MKYIVHKRFKGRVIRGEVNLPYGTRCESVGNYICLDGKPLVSIASENAHQYFARNDDGAGLLRGRLTQSIQLTLSKRDAGHQARWDRVWEDPELQRFKRQEHANYWLWNHAFFEAEISDLKYIAALIGARGG